MSDDEEVEHGDGVTTIETIESRTEEEDDE